MKERNAESVPPEDAVASRVREACMALPGTTETGSWGHPNFKANGRTFVAFEWIQGRPSIAFRLSPVEIASLLHEPRYFPTPYGKGQWVSLWADARLDWRTVNGLIRRSHEQSSQKQVAAPKRARARVRKKKG